MRFSSYQKSSLLSRTALLYLAAALISLSVLAVGAYTLITRTSPAHAATMTFSLFATHPYASKAGYDNTSTNYYTGTELCPASSGKTFCPAGQTITDMEVTEDGHLVAGYGDWNSNVDSFGVTEGRVGVVPLNLADGTWGDMFYAGSEAIDVVRKINGKLYIPTTDPSDKAATGNPSGNISGYITNETGDWSFVRNGSPANIHTFDVAIADSGERYTSGSRPISGPDSSSVRASSDGGVTWSDSYIGNDTVGAARSYWTIALDGKVYAGKASQDGGGAVAFDDTNWGEVSGFSCSTVSTKTIVVFDNRIVCHRSSTSIIGTVGTFDGENEVDITFTTSAVGNASVRDFYADDQYLYVLTVGGEIYRTDNLSDAGAWRRVDSTTPNSANSVAVQDGYIYIGSADGQIFRSSSVISESVLVDPMTTPEEVEGATPSSCFQFNLSTGTITDYYDHELNNPANPVCSRDVIIPEAISGNSVTAIGGLAFTNNQITSIVIPDSVITIGANAFSVNQITELVIPDSVITIEGWSFRNNQITELTIPSSVTTIGASAFTANKITELAIPDSVTTIGSAAFSGNEISSLTISDSVVTIGANTFSGNKITELAIPDSVTTIGGAAFANNQIAELVIPNSVTSIESGAFATNQITELTIPNSVTTIGGSAFSGNQITDLTIPNSVTTIGASALNGNPLTNLSIDMVNIPGSVFSYRNIEHLYIGNSVSTIGDGAFRNNQITELTIPDSVTVIGSNAFNTNQIADLTIPNSVTTIGASAFNGNPLTNLSIDMVNIPGLIFNGKDIEFVYIGNSVTTIGNNALSSNQITELTIPDSVTTIGNSAFAASQISDIVIGNSVTTIGSRAFYNNQITELTIPDSVTSIGDYAFENNNVSRVYMKGETELGAEVFVSSSVASFSGCVAAISPPPTEYSEFIPCYESSFAPSDSAKLIQLYADNPDYYEDELYFETVYSELLGVTPAVLGGHIVNPASTTASYSSRSGAKLQESSTKVGENLSSHSLKELFDTYPDVTTSDLADIYYRQGQQLTVQPLEIAGYQTPSPQTITLASSDNEVSFVYRSMSGDGGNDGSGDSSDESDDGESVGAPNTGIGMILKSKIGVAIGLIILALAATGTLLYRKRAQRY